MKTLEVKAYSAGFHSPIVRDVSFSASAGEIVGILGRNGSGKTTLLRGICRSAKHYGGEVRVLGEDCTRLSAKKLARKLAVLPQETVIPKGLSGKNIIEMGLYAAKGLFQSATPIDMARAEKITQRLGIQEILEKDCGEMSQGQRQMVFLARILLQDCPVLLLDEPDASLDYYNAHIFFSLLQNLVSETQKNVLLVLHNPTEALNICHRLLLMQNGQLLSEIDTKTESVASIQQKLSLIYPEIMVKKDSNPTSFRCFLPEVNQIMKNLL